MKPTYLWILWWCLIVSVFSTHTPLFAQQTTRITIDARVGFDNIYTVDAWTPVTLTVRGDDQDRVVTVEWLVNDDQGNRVIWSREISLPAQTTKELKTNVVMPGYARSIVARVQSDNRILASTLVDAQSASGTLNVAVSDDANLLKGLNETILPDGTPIILAVIPPAQLPDNPIALQGIYNLFIENPGTLSAAQHDAIQLWLELGGRVVVADNVTGNLAQNTELTLDYTTPYTVTLPDDAPAPLPSSIVVPSISEPSSATTIDVHPGSHLLWERPIGRGTFYQTTVPFTALRDWSGLTWLWRPVLQPVYPDIRSMVGRPNLFIQNDPLGSSLNIAALSRPHPVTIFLIIIGYIALVGPVTYFVLKRRYTLDWAWVSIPVTALIITGMLAITGFILRGTNTLVHTLTIVQQHANARHALVSAGTALYTPFRSSYQATINDADGIISIRDSQVVAGLRFQDDKNAQIPLNGDIGSVQYVHAHRMVAAPLSVTHDLTATATTLNGTISIAGVDLQDVVVFYGSQGQLIGNTTQTTPIAVAINEQTSQFPCDIAGDNDAPIDQRRLYEIIAGPCFAVTALPTNRVLVYGWSDEAINPPTIQEARTNTQRQLYVITINIP